MFQEIQAYDAIVGIPVGQDGGRANFLRLVVDSIDLAGLEDLVDANGELADVRDTGSGQS